MKDLRGFARAAVFFIGVTAQAGPPQAGLQLDVSVVDQSKLAFDSIVQRIRAAAETSSAPKPGSDPTGNEPGADEPEPSE